MTRFERKDVIELSELDALIDAANNDDVSAMSRLRELSSTYSQRANARMRELERRGLESTPLQRAQHYLESQRDRTRFGAGKGADMDTVIENVQQARRFLSAQTSTVGGFHQHQERTLQGLERAGVIDEFTSAGTRREYLRFLESDVWKDNKKYIGSGALTTAQQAIEDGAKVSDLVDAFRAYSDGTKPSAQLIFDEWTMIE